MMRNMGPRALFLLLWALLATNSAAGQAQVAGWTTFVTPVLGLEEPGAAFFPARFAQGSVVEILDPQGLEVHLIDVDGSGEEWVRPAGTAVVPPRGRWRLWLEGEWRMTPYTDVAVFPSAVDLTDQDDAFVTLSPELIELFGKVSYAGEGHAATVNFQTVAGDQVAVESDEEGEYRVVTLHPLRWVTVTLDGVDQEPWRDFFAPPLAASRELDFDVPDARVEVRVVDAETRQGVPLARVAVRNEFVLPSESGDESSGGRERVLAQSYQTDDSGWTRLPPPRPGTIEVWASADGYRETVEPLVVEVADPPQDRQIELVLQPVGGGVGLTLKLADGSPAAGARVLLVESLTGGRPLFDGRADAMGTVVVPAEHERGLLLLTHPKASFGIVEWSSWHDQERVDWSFPATPREQLSVRVMDASGRVPVAGAALSVWVGRWHLSGLSLRWLLAANPTTGADGLWTAEGLPRGPVRLLARADEASAEAASRWENLATEATFPWPRLVELRVVR